MPCEKYTGEHPGCYTRPSLAVGRPRAVGQAEVDDRLLPGRLKPVRDRECGVPGIWNLQGRLAVVREQERKNGNRRQSSHGFTLPPGLPWTPGCLGCWPPESMGRGVVCCANVDYGICLKATEICPEMCKSLKLLVSDGWKELMGQGRPEGLTWEVP